MGSITGTTLAARAAALLHDVTYDRWTQAEHLTYINDGQKEISLIKPDAYVVNVAYQLVAGTKQSIPDGTSSFQDPSSSTIAAGIQLLDVVRNMGTDGLTPGNVITLTDMERLDMAYPGWHSETASATVIHYMFRETDPKRFYTYPKQPAASMGWIEIIMAAVPPDLSLIGSTIEVDNIYQNALINYMLHKAYMKDAEYAANRSLADKYYDLFQKSLLNKDMREKADDPNPGVR